MKRSVTKKPRLTKWFDGSKFVPFKAGVYEVEQAGLFQFWSGKAWGLVSSSKKHAAIRGTVKSRFQNFKWRGLAQKPEVQP